MTSDEEANAEPPFMRGECVTCHRLNQPICCGDNTNGFWCLDCCPHPYTRDDDGYPYDDEDNGDEEFDCHMDRRHGSCGLAGTEECEFECPYRNLKRN